MPTRGRNDVRGSFLPAGPVTLLAVAVLAIGLTSVSSAPDARAAFPGANGAIIFSTDSPFENNEVYSINPDGSDLTNLSNHGARDAYPAVSPDGKKIVFSSDRTGNLEIYVMDVDGSGLTRLTNNSSPDYQPSFSPDGSKIVFTSVRFTEDPDSGIAIWLMNADGSGETMLAGTAGANSPTPMFSPNGQRIVFTRNHPEGHLDNLEIYSMSPSGSGLTNLSNNAAIDVDPDFSPDGSRIVFSSSRDGGSGIFTMNPDGSDLAKIGDQGFAPAFSPDGEKVVFSGNDGIYIMDADGTNRSGPFGPGTNVVALSWQPGQGCEVNLEALRSRSSAQDEAPARCPFVVNVTADKKDEDVGDGTCDINEDKPQEQCSLRAAVAETNDAAGPDKIHFDIDASGTPTIRIKTLIQVTESVTIDGTTQPGTPEGRPGVELAGPKDDDGKDGLVLKGSNSVVRGLVVNDFGRAGIVLEGGGGHTVDTNWIGLHKSGTKPEPNSTGVRVRSPNNTIGGTAPTSINYISGNGRKQAALNYMNELARKEKVPLEDVVEVFSRLGVGVLVDKAGADNNIIAGNLIGGSAIGKTLIGNSVGVLVAAFGGTVTGTRIGGTVAEGQPSNTILGNNIGVVVGGAAGGVNDTTVTGNAIGLTPAGEGGKNGAGILVAGQADGLTIGGPGPLVNVVARSGVGISLVSKSLRNVRLEHNLIGPDKSLANGIGLMLTLTDGVKVGAPGAGNAFPSNSMDMLMVGAKNSVIEDNEIGLEQPSPDPTSVQGVVGLTIAGGNGNHLRDNEIRDRVVGLFMVNSKLNVVESNTISDDIFGALVLRSASNRFGGIGTGNTFVSNVLGLLVSNDEPRDRDLRNAELEDQPIQPSDLEKPLRTELAEGPVNLADALTEGNIELDVRRVGSAANNEFKGNYFGTDAQGTGGLGNAFAAWFTGTVDSTTFGGTSPGEGNVVTASRYAGLWLGGKDLSNSPQDLAIRGNSFSGNGPSGLPLYPGRPALAIDLIIEDLTVLARSFGPTENDPLDVDGGPNGAQNYPELTSATLSSGTTNVLGTFNSSTNKSFVIEFFSSSSCHPSGFGEGKTPLGHLDVTTDAGGNAPIDVNLPGAASGEAITATATRVNENGGATSEFSRCVSVS